MAVKSQSDLVECILPKEMKVKVESYRRKYHQRSRPQSFFRDDTCLQFECPYHLKEAKWKHKYLTVRPEKNRQMSIKVTQKLFHLKIDRFWHKNCLWMWEIRANELLPKALKTCPKSNKLPNLVTLESYCDQFCKCSMIKNYSRAKL